MSYPQSLIESTSLGAKFAGFGAIGLALQEVTGYPGLFWVSALVGVMIIRRPFDGLGWRSGLFAFVVGISWSWLATNPTLDVLGLASDIYLAPVAGFWAGFGEYVGKLLKDPERLGNYVGIVFRGRGK